MIHLSIQLLIDACLNDPHSMQSSAFDVLIHICTSSVRAITCICSASVSNAEQLSKVHWHQLCLSSQCPPAAGALKSVLGNKPSQNVKRHETIIVYFPQCCKCSGFLCVVLLWSLWIPAHTHTVYTRIDIHTYTEIQRNWEKGILSLVEWEDLPSIALNLTRVSQPHYLFDLCPKADCC